ncbi:hypothetical protein PYW07_016208 [Mythimna separata]|uniref:Ig-like domain-containing protein n=1 Tax=Mythimna separata TaxID=271217 RepID=A0AAD7YS68_MYTSE|nr:hypothetical protein PYW07_016208 [Mythimna separata]
MWWLVKLSIVLQCVHSVRITNMRVPEVVQYGVKDSVTLDCEFEADNVTGLVVKWFYTDRLQLVYQWIPPHKPQALGILRNRVDLSHKVSDNPYTQHRAVHITSVVPELTGNYTCVVSTFMAEDEKTSPMTIFVTETKFDMIQDRLNDKFLNIICSVEGVYPKPELGILVGNRPQRAKSSIKVIDGRYTALTSTVVNIERLPPTVEILCEMMVPSANYYSKKREVFYRDPPATDIPSFEPVSPDSGHHITSTSALVIISIVISSLRLHAT